LTLTDKRTGSVFPGLHRFVDGGDRGDEYNYCRPEADRLIGTPETPPNLRLVEAGPTRQTLEVTQAYVIPASLDDNRSRRGEELVRLPIRTRVSLSPGVPRLEFATKVENHAQDHRLRVHFPVPIVTDVSHAEGHFDVPARPLALPQNTSHWLEQPVPTHHQRTFVSVGDGKAGMLVANRGLPEYEVMATEQGVDVALTLLRCVGWLSRDDMHCRRGHAGPGYATPGAQCPGTHTFEYALIPHEGTWKPAYDQAHAFNAPLRAVAGSAGGGSLPLEMSFVEVTPPTFVLTAIKQAEDGNGLILRGFNITDEPQEVRLGLALKVRRAFRTRLDERGREELGVEGKGVHFEAGPKEIVTIRFER
jgi:alpha-mannosidase